MPPQVLVSVASVSNAPTRPLGPVAASVAARVALAGGVAAAVALTGRAYGGHAPTVWGPLGLVLVVATGTVLVFGRRPRLLVAAGAALFVLLGTWSAASPAWGGVPDSAWKMLDQTLLAAAALLLGSLISTDATVRKLVLIGVLAGLVAQAGEVLVRIVAGTAPDSWFYVRFLEGPVGYHNAQAGMLALGLPLAFWLVQSSSRVERLAGGASAGLLLGPLLLTQSRAALGAVALASVLQLAISRGVRLAAFLLAFVGAALVLVTPLRNVDAALAAEAGSGAARLETFAWTTFAVAALLAVAAVPNYATKFGRRFVATAAATALAALLAVGVAHGEIDTARERIAAGVAELRSDEVIRRAPGETRLTSLSLNGRKDAWRVAWAMAEESPVVGAGYGRFTAEWAKERRLRDLYLLQPHSLPFEIVAELGFVGIGLFAGSVLLLLVALAKAPDRRLAAAALGALVVLLAQAAVDWTWSFPVLVAVTLFTVGVAAGAGRRSELRLQGFAFAALAVSAVALIMPQYLVAEHLARAAELRRSDARRAWLHAEAALDLNRWSADALELQGKIAEADGRTKLAAQKYGAAARYARRPWLPYFYEARVLARAGDRVDALAACRRALAASPFDAALRTGPCGGRS